MIKNIEIVPTDSSQDFEICAKMMAISEPWTRLGFDFKQCVLAFDGLGKEVYLMKNEQEIAGFVIMQTIGTFKGYIQTLCIDEKFRGEGLGLELLRFCEKRILTYSPNVFICVSDFNLGAIKLYKKFGFEQIGELKNFVKEGFIEIFMRKTFGAISTFSQNK